VERSDIQRAASEVAGKSRSFLSAQLDERTTQLGTSITSTAVDLRRIAGELRGSEAVSGAADVADRGADLIERIGTYLCDADGDRLVADAEDFARARPWATAIAALTAGFAASRVLKVSSAERYRSAASDGP
jgi:hypothetical protein